MRAKSNAVLLGHWIIKKKYIVGCVTTSLIIAFQSLTGYVLNYWTVLETLFRFPVCVTDFGSSAHNVPPLCWFIPFHVRPFHVGPIHASQIMPGHFMPVPFHVNPMSCLTVLIHARPISCPSHFMPVCPNSCQRRPFHVCPTSCQSHFMSVPFHVHPISCPYHFMPGLSHNPEFS